MNGLCPACRTPYDEKNYRLAERSPAEEAREAKAKQRDEDYARGTGGKGKGQGGRSTSSLV